MATRIMIDGTNNEAQAIKREFGDPQMLAYYVTGSQGIPWTAADIALFPKSVHVTIDQGGSGSPVPSAIVRDVEPGAWNADAAVRHVPWTAKRPTIYCDRNDLQAVIAAGWRKDVWLAWPGFAGTAAPSFAGVNIVAVQNVFGTDHDSSLVFDATWPQVPVTPTPGPRMSVSITDRVVNLFFPVMVGADHYIVEYIPPSPGVMTVLSRPPQAKSGSGIHVTNLTVPGGTGGEIVVQAVIKSVQHQVGAISLP